MLHGREGIEWPELVGYGEQNDEKSEGRNGDDALPMDAPKAFDVNQHDNLRNIVFETQSDTVDRTHYTDFAHSR